MGAGREAPDEDVAHSSSHDARLRAWQGGREMEGTCRRPRVRQENCATRGETIRAFPKRICNSDGLYCIIRALIDAKPRGLANGSANHVALLFFWKKKFEGPFTHPSPGARNVLLFFLSAKTVSMREPEIAVLLS